MSRNKINFCLYLLRVVYNYNIYILCIVRSRACLAYRPMYLTYNPQGITVTYVLWRDLLTASKKQHPWYGRLCLPIPPRENVNNWTHCR